MSGSGTSKGTGKSGDRGTGKSANNYYPGMGRNGGAIKKITGRD